MALVEANINCILREVNLKNKPPSLLQISPKGTVPVLYFNDGTVIEESLEIIYYALEQQSSSTEKKQIAAMLHSNDNDFAKLLKAYKYPEKHPNSCPISCRDQIEEKFLSKYEQMLGGRLFLYGNKKSILDIAILPFIRQFSIVDPEWFFNSQYHNIISWLKMFTDSQDFKNIVMAKHQPWDKSSTQVYLL